jgi:hypothetical protein
MSPLRIPCSDDTLLAASKAAAEARAALTYGTTRYRADDNGIKWFSAEEVAGARDQVAPVLSLYDQALRPAGPDFTQALVAMLSAAYPPSRGTDEDAELKLQIYADALQEFPADLLAEAARQHLRQSRFFPTVAELIRAGEASGLERRHYTRVHMRNMLGKMLGEPLIALPQIRRSVAEEAADCVFGSDGQWLP